MLDGSCATHKMQGVYSGYVQPKGTFCPLIAKKTLLKLVCTNEGCDREMAINEPDEEGEARYKSLLMV